MSFRAWNVLGVFVMLAAGGLLLLAPYPANPQIGDSSDFLLYGLLAAFVGMIACGAQALTPPESYSVFALFASGVVLLCLVIVGCAHLLLWTA